ncbi:LppU/SCO3897 family protein [Streptomyces griseoviridis]|uniref:LppU/SCO3897 family protein n=1 Tax=Streptomyces griseoviridis TaxID=45398 RepID=UPI003452C917
MTTPPPQGQNPSAPSEPPAPQGPPAPEGSAAPQGQAPYPQHAGQAPYPPHPGFPQQGAPVPPPRGRRVSKTLIRVGAFVVLAIVLAVVKFYVFQSDAETTSVGSCMHNDGSQTKPDLKTVDCSSSEAQFKVVEKFDGTSDDSRCETVQGATISYYQSGNNHDVVLCLNEVK